MHTRLFISALSALLFVGGLVSTSYVSAQEKVAQVSHCQKCGKQASCCESPGCGHGFGLMDKVRGRLACCCCGYLPIPVLGSGNMPQRQQYHNEPNGSYYFRPYNYSSISRQQNEATWATRNGQPYSNDVFKNVYAQVEANGGQPVYVAPTGQPAESIQAPTPLGQPGKSPAKLKPGNSSQLPLPAAPTPKPAAPRPLSPPPVTPLLPGPPTP